MPTPESLMLLAGLLMLVGSVAGSSLIVLGAYRLNRFAKELALSNSSTQIAPAITALANIITTQAATIADLNTKLAAVDPDQAADLAADEGAIADAVSQANAIVAAQPANPAS